MYEENEYLESDVVNAAAMQLLPSLSNIEAEQAVLGSILLDDTAIDKCGKLSVKSFYHIGHQLIFQTMLEMQQASNRIDVITLSEALKTAGRLDLCGGFNYLVDLAQNMPSAANLNRYVGIVSERANSRHALMLVADFLKNLEETRGGNADALISNLARSLDDIAVSREDNEATFDTASLMKIGVDEFAKRVDAGGEFVGLSTGIDTLDDRLMGLQGGGLYVVAGRPAMGKTVTAMSIAEHVADKYAEQGAVLVFNMEMSKEQLALRSLAAASGVSLHDLQMGYGGNQGENYLKLNEAAAKAETRKMFVDVRANITIGQIRAKARQVKNRHGLTLIVIDYLQLLDEPNRKFGNDNERVAWLSRQTKKIAKEFDVPVILLSQLSRKVEERADKRPLMSDLRDSGAIEQDADAIIMNYRDGYYSKDDTDTMIELLVEKQRMGQTGAAYACFEGQYSRIVNVSEVYINAMFDKRSRPSEQQQQPTRKRKV